MHTESDSLRLDKWLWAARFYKTRKLAADAISGGKVHLNQQRTKPGKEVKIADLLSISKDNCRWDITIIFVSAQRRSAKEAVLLYEESLESFQKRQHQILLLRTERELFDFSGRDHKPNKKERRLIHKFKVNTE